MDTTSMTLDRRFLNWGVFFIVLGAVPLAVRGNLLTRDVVTGAWRLWPVLLIGLGLGILLRRTPWALVGGLVAAATFGLVLGSALAVGPDVVGCGGATGTGTAFDQHGTFAGPASVDISVACGTLAVTSQAGSDWTLHAIDRGGSPHIDSSPSSLTARSGRSGGFFAFANGGDDWRLSLPSQTYVGLRAELNAARATFDLGSAHLNTLNLTINAGDVRTDLTDGAADDLSVTVNAGNASIALPANGDTSGSVTVNAGSFNLCAPPGLGLRLNSSQALGATNFDQSGLVRSGNTWTSANYVTAPHKADLSITVNLGSATLNPTGGCK